MIMLDEQLVESLFDAGVMCLELRRADRDEGLHCGVWRPGYIWLEQHLLASFHVRLQRACDEDMAEGGREWPEWPR